MSKVCIINPHMYKYAIVFSMKEKHEINQTDAFVGDTTGTESIYTVYEGHEVMFHVSSFLPHSEDNRQQVLTDN